MRGESSGDSSLISRGCDVIRIVYGFEQGRTLLERRPTFQIETPPSIENRNIELFGSPISTLEGVRRILSDVRENGDGAVQDYARRIDGQETWPLEIPKEHWRAAKKKISNDLTSALETAANRIRAFHQTAIPTPWYDDSLGYGERLVPLERVGIYVPGGTANYPSTVLMAGIPARVAGVKEIVVCTPDPSPVVLAAAQIADVDRLFQIGGAQAIGAMAFGTASVPQVDKVCGPGNIFVTLAKREVYGIVDIDGLYGPTETVVVADGSADPVLCAADLLAQAEHDVMASPILLTTSHAIAERVATEIETQLKSLTREPIARTAIETQGVAVVVDNLQEAIALVNAFAPEHVSLLVQDPAAFARSVQHAGGIFIGENSPEVIGDYVAGPSHIMPTGGTARFASYLGVHQFLKHMPVVSLSFDRMRELGPSAVALGMAEGLTAHARAMSLRLENETYPKDKSSG